MLHLLCLALASFPMGSPVVLPDQGAVRQLSLAEINAFTPFTLFASVAYCTPKVTINWNCGEKCNANAGFIPVASGGNGVAEPYWYVGFYPALNTVVVGHQPADLTQFIQDVEIANLFLTPLDQTLFPATPDLKVHNGFLAFHARSAANVLAAVRTALARHDTTNATSVTIVGYSLGAAIGLINAVYLPLHLPPTTKFKFVGYGMPRVGNPPFANYLDEHFSDLTHINNKNDLVPIIPAEFLGYRHPQGEIHIDDNGTWNACPGDDNESKLCSTGAVPTIIQGNVFAHGGPYNNIVMSCS